MRFIFFFLFNFPLLILCQSDLSLEDIMGGNDFIGHQPNHIKWSPDNETFFFKWQKENDSHPSYWSNNGTTLLNLKTEHIFDKPVSGYLTNSEKNAFYFQQGDKIYYHSEAGPKQIYQSAVSFQIHKVFDHEKIIIRQNNTYFAFNHAKGFLKQCINFNMKPPPAVLDSNYLFRQQYELFDYIKDVRAEQLYQDYTDSLLALNKVPQFNCHKKSIGLFEIDSALSFVFFRTDIYPKNKGTQIEQNITASGYASRVSARPKVGGDYPSHELYWMDLTSRRSDKIDISQLPGIYKKPDYFRIYNPSDLLEYTEPKAVIFTQVKMNSTGDLAFIEIKSNDNKDRWIALFNVKTKTLTCIDHQHDEAWIGGPGISGWNMVSGNIGWLKDDKTIYFQSEKTGFSHLYSYQINDNKTTALTEGNYEIYNAVPSQNGDLFYITSNRSKPGNRSFYHFHIATKKWIPILENDGNYEVYVSPNEDKLAIRYSYKNKPWEIYTCHNSEKGKLTSVTTSTRAAFNQYQWREPEIITFKNQQNKTVYARLYKPEISKRNGAAVQFVHGAGYLQNAHNWWSAYYREYMFHNLLCDYGYTVIDIDYSASEGYGRDFRTSIYRHMGGQDLDDQIAGRQYLIDQEKIDPNRIAIYGGSYGGFITIMGLLKYPGYFKCGAAIRSVTDWAHYNHAYTSNILNTPDTDSIAYRRSSPIYFAQNLKDHLLILHGMMDDNVQFQDVVRLNQRFIELGKMSFEMAIYPVEPHGFIKKSSWIDEYSRILALFNNQLLN